MTQEEKLIRCQIYRLVHSAPEQPAAESQEQPALVLKSSGTGWMTFF